MDPNFVIEPTHVIQRQLWEISATGPKSYSALNGDVINFQSTQFPSAVPGGFLTKSGSYELKPFPSITSNLRPTWAFRWFYSGVGNSQGVDSVVIATAGTGQTNGVYTATSSTGGAVLQYTIAGGLLTGIKLLNPGSGLTAVPTFTIAAGGTPGTVTATIGSVAGVEVGDGTDLSAEQVQFFVIGGEM